MRLLCIICPPLAVLLCGKPIQALVNLLLTLLLVIPGVIHAWSVVTDSRADKKHREMVSAVRSNKD
jgi:uncharacterized membrane protein YqaE (UPF0057 family)